MQSGQIVDYNDTEVYTTQLEDKLYDGTNDKNLLIYVDCFKEVFVGCVKCQGCATYECDSKLKCDEYWSEKRAADEAKQFAAWLQSNSDITTKLQ